MSFSINNPGEIVDFPGHQKPHAEDQFTCLKIVHQRYDSVTTHRKHQRRFASIVLKYGHTFTSQSVTTQVVSKYQLTSYLSTTFYKKTQELCTAINHQ